MEDYEYRPATPCDIGAILKLHAKYHTSTIAAEERKDGFVTTNFTLEQIHALVSANGISLCVLGKEILAYAMSASWEFWSAWPMFAHMIKDLPNVDYHTPLTTDNSYQYGPVCIDSAHRGKGILEALFGFSMVGMRERYDYAVTFINKANPRSFNAHTRKVGFEVLKEFEFNGNSYYELVHDIRP